MTSPRTSNQIERKIHFYRINAGLKEDKTPNKLNLIREINKVSKLSFDNKSNRYWTQPDGDAIGIWLPDNTKSFDKFSLAAVRRSGLPQKELNGKLNALNLGVGAGLHEPVHMKLFPDNIIGVEFNFYGPRPSRLPHYLKHACPDSPSFTLEALLSKDMEDQIKKHKETRLVELQIRPSYITKVREASKSLGKAFDALNESGAEVLGLTLRPAPRQRTPLNKSILEGVKKLAKRTDLPENVVQFKTKGVNGDTGQVEVLNLLDDQLVAKRKIVTISKTSRAVDPTAAYEAIQSAYEELKTELMEAAGISISGDDHDD